MFVFGTRGAKGTPPQQSTPRCLQTFILIRSAYRTRPGRAGRRFALTAPYDKQNTASENCCQSRQDVKLDKQNHETLNNQAKSQCRGYRAASASRLIYSSMKRVRSHVLFCPAHVFLCLAVAGCVCIFLFLAGWVSAAARKER